jgi:tripartite-type tricarboxylate transporter receptor subunit TctC
VFLRKSLVLSAALAVLAVSSVSANAQSWPTKPITMVVVFAPGGTVDIVGRTVANQLTQQLGQQVIVDNKAGAGGTIGAAAVARAKPDGYTILMLVSSHAVGETLYKKRPYDLSKDFTPVSLIGTSPYWLLVNPEVNKTPTLKELVAKIRENPGKMTYASGGSGGIAHLASEMMNLQGKLDVTHVPFKGNAPALTELVAGRVDMMFDQPASSTSFVKAGKLKPLAVTSKTRLAAYPDIPTMAESGFPGYEAISWFGFAVPAGTPPQIVKRLNEATVKALASPEVKDKLEATGITTASSTPAAFSEMIKTEIGRWRTVINDAKVTTE